MPISFEIPDEYPWTVLACIALCLECVLVSAMIVVPARKKYFPNEFMKKNFAEIHKENYPGHRAQPLGFPDVGSGIYSDKLSYKEWFLFNNAMRSHLNIVEQIHFLLVFFLVGGLILPKITMVLAWLGVIGRAFYVIGYTMKGPNARLFGAFLNLIPNYFTTLFVLFVLISAAVKNAGYLSATQVPQAVTA